VNTRVSAPSFRPCGGVAGVLLQHVLRLRRDQRGDEAARRVLVEAELRRQRRRVFRLPLLAVLDEHVRLLARELHLDARGRVGSVREQLAVEPLRALARKLPFGDAFYEIDRVADAYVGAASGRRPDDEIRGARSARERFHLGRLVALDLELGETALVRRDDVARFDAFHGVEQTVDGRFVRTLTADLPHVVFARELDRLWSLDDDAVDLGGIDARERHVRDAALRLLAQHCRRCSGKPEEDDDGDDGALVHGLTPIRASGAIPAAASASSRRGCTRPARRGCSRT
jgi:hypothetical protein